MQRRYILGAIIGAGVVGAIGYPFLSPDGQTAMAGEIPVFIADGAAIRGYDPVAYFTEGRPVEGSAAHTSTWNGAEWRFASAEHKAKFDDDPAAYAPEYGGHCAYAVANGDLVSIDPTAWKIRDERLFLNYSPAIQQRWEADVESYISRANDAWQTLIN